MVSLMLPIPLVVPMDPAPVNAAIHVTPEAALGGPLSPRETSPGFGELPGRAPAGRPRAHRAAGR